MSEKKCPRVQWRVYVKGFKSEMKLKSIHNSYAQISRLTCSPLSHSASANSKKTETQSAGLGSIFLLLDLDEDSLLRTPGRLMAICRV